ncbi:MAG TPA: hypothetical protein VGQ52_10150 [Gemmatimonadaceae bacterium]|nr:hypothetical protein [Gemmatimonadaceae bacterium]
MAGVLAIPMDRMGSGTTWIPDAVSLPAHHFKLSDWTAMLHGFVFGQYDHQSGPRGDDQWGSLNWGMLMVSRELGGGHFQARTMLSLDPFTVTKRGYPLLAQTGETFDGQPLHDRQHPHDFWMELGAIYERPISSKLALSLYAAPSGEPALGPVAFMHRPSAMDDPVAPLGHHWQDATHISFGVLTLGLFTSRWKVEGSIFNGREPNEERWDFDRLKLDSYSGRLTVNPDSQWSFALGYGFLKSPESLEPDESLHRTTASILHGRRLGADGQWATSVVWGANADGRQRVTHALLVETEAILDRQNTLFARADRTEKSAGELVLLSGPGGVASDRLFKVSAFSLGYIRELARPGPTTLGLGIRGTLNVLPQALEPYYGSRTPTGLVVFLRLRPVHNRAMHAMPGMKMEHHAGASP